MDEKGVKTTTARERNFLLGENRSPKPSLVKRVGLITLLILVLSLFVVLACVGFIIFLWFSTADNGTWHKIMVNGWATRSISLTSTALRWAVGVQSALGLAMLAALALEGYDVPLPAAATLSMMRVNGSGLVQTLKDVSWPIARHGPAGAILRSVMPILLLLTTSTLLQFTSTALLSDLKNDYMPGYSTSTNVSIDYWYHNLNDSRTGYFYVATTADEVWLGNRPAFWPAFAEYSEPPFEHENVSDTGMNLRAFLPFSTADERQTVRNYSGKAVVYDSRVTCQRPEFNGGKGIYSIDGLYNSEDAQYVFWGDDVQPTVLTPRLNVSDRAVAFNCPWSKRYTDRFAICELHNEKAHYPATDEYVYPGTLVSEFRNYPPLDDLQSPSGAGYIVVSVNNSDYNLDSGEWANVILTTPSEEDNSLLDYWNVTVTLCYAALDVADRHVDVYSSSNRTEPQTGWNQTFYKDDARHFDDYIAFDYTELFNQFLTGYPEPKTAEERGILAVVPPANGWAADESSESGYDGPITNAYTRNTESVLYPLISNYVHLTAKDGYWWGNYSAILDPGYIIWSSDYASAAQAGANPWIISMFEQLIDKESVAVALQSVLFSLAETAYFDHLPQYDKSEQVTYLPFVPVLNPGGPFGTKRTALPIGFTIVMVVLFTHLVFFGLVFFWFAIGSRYSRLGDTWLAVAHVVDAELTAAAIRAQRSVEADREVGPELLRPLQADGMRDNVCVGLAETDDREVYLRKRD